MARRARLPLRSDITANQIPVADSFPAFRSLVPLRSGGLWIEEVRPDDAARASWLVLNAEGEPEARVLAPPDLEILDIRGELILGYTLDTFDVPHVMLTRVSPRR